MAYHSEISVIPLHDSAGVNRQKGSTTDISQVPCIWAKGYYQ